MGKRKIVMIGPHLQFGGGISRVAGIWKENGFFKEHDVTYIPSVAGQSTTSKLFSLTKALLLFIFLLRKSRLTYVHSAVDRSFYRKSLFIGISSLARVPIVLHIHPNAFIDFVRRSGKMGRKYILFFLRRVRHFVVLTYEMKTEIESMLPGKSIFLLRNPVSLREMSRKPVPRPENRFLYLGYYEKGKGVYDLVDAIEILCKKGSTVNLDLYGTGQIRHLREYVRNKGLSHLVSVHDWVNGNAKIDVLYRCTALVLPSYTEGIPNVILEAMATKTPIISTLAGGLKEILSNRENAIVVQAGNPVDLSEKIVECMEDTALRDTISQNAYLEAATKYDIPIIKAEFRSIVRRILVDDEIEDDCFDVRQKNA